MPQPPDPAHLARARAVHRAEAERLWTVPGVTGVAVGLERTRGEPTGQVAIVVYVARKLPVAELAPEDVLPEEIDGVPVDVVESTFRALAEDHQARHDPLLGGVSLGLADRPGSGTLGGRIFDDTTGTDSLVSNWHVICRSDDCTGARVIQPGPSDDGGSADEVARVHDGRLTDRVDASLAISTSVRAIRPETLGIGPLGGLATAEIATNVRKSGRTTGVTVGIITGFGDFLVRMNGGVRIFRGQVVIGQPGFSAPGDSGSLVLDHANRVVALLFAGSAVATIANPIEAVLTTFGITADAELLADQLL